MRRLATYCVALLLGLSLGLQWTVLQSVAWASMIVQRAPEMGLEDAVRSTFDGQRPCSLCRISKAGRDAQKKAEQVTSLKKHDWVASPTTGLVIVRESSVAGFPAAPSPAGRGPDSPTAPPPKAA